MRRVGGGEQSSSYPRMGEDGGPITGSQTRRSELAVLAPAWELAEKHRRSEGSYLIHTCQGIEGFTNSAISSSKAEKCGNDLSRGGIGASGASTRVLKDSIIRAMSPEQGERERV